LSRFSPAGCMGFHRFGHHADESHRPTGLIERSDF
jgi:hypothetical protein